MRRNVEGRLPVAARAARIQQRAVKFPASTRIMFPRIACANPANSSAVSPFIRSATANAAIWAVVASPPGWRPWHGEPPNPEQIPGSSGDGGRAKATCYIGVCGFTKEPSTTPESYENS